jgi:hypothetical protein
MVQYADKRYFNRESLLKFLQSIFPDHKNFSINGVSDAHFSFEAPRKITHVRFYHAISSGKVTNIRRTNGCEWLHALPATGQR